MITQTQYRPEAIKMRCSYLGIDLDDRQLIEINNRLKRSYPIDDADLIQAIKGSDIPEHFRLKFYYPNVNNSFFVYIEMMSGNDLFTGGDYGNGLIDAAVRAMKPIIDRDYRFEDFKCFSLGENSSAKSHAEITVGKNGWFVLGRNEHFDVVTSSINAYLDGCNRMRYLEDNLIAGG